MKLSVCSLSSLTLKTLLYFSHWVICIKIDSISHTSRNLKGKVLRENKLKETISISNFTWRVILDMLMYFLPSLENQIEISS